jgi:hypothetical protein
MKRFPTPGLDEWCKNATQARNGAYHLYLARSTRGMKQELDRLNRQVHSICQRKKRKHMTEKILKIGEEFNSGNLYMVYKEIQTIKGGFKAHTNLCKDKDGILMGDKESIKSRWAEHFKLLLNPKQSGKKPCRYISDICYNSKK